MINTAAAILLWHAILRRSKNHFSLISTLSAWSDLKFTYVIQSEENLFQLLPLFIPASVCLLTSLPQATTFSFVCFCPSGFHGLCVSGVLLMLLLGLGAPLGYLFELLLPLAVCAIAVSFLFSVYLYIRSFWAPSHALALGGNTGESGGSSLKEESTLKCCLKTVTGDVLCFCRPLLLFGGGFWYSCG